MFAVKIHRDGIGLVAISSQVQFLSPLIRLFRLYALTQSDPNLT
jgi:hypothetical protein